MKILDLYCGAGGASQGYYLKSIPPAYTEYIGSQILVKLLSGNN